MSAFTGRGESGIIVAGTAGRTPAKRPVFCRGFVPDHLCGGPGDPERSGDMRRSKSDTRRQPKQPIDLQSLVPDHIRKIRAYVRQGNHRQELQEAIELARGYRPDILDWLEPYLNRTMKEFGCCRDRMPPRGLDKTEGLVLNRVLVAMAHDFWTPRHEDKIAYDPYARHCGDPFDLGAFDLRVWDDIAPELLEMNRGLVKRVDDALAELEADDQPKQTKGASAAKTANTAAPAVDIATDGSSDVVRL